MTPAAPLRLLGEDDTAPEPVVELRGLGFAYPGSSRPILANFDLTIGRGEFVAIVGSSGVGKSTLLRFVAGLAKPDEGEIVLHAAREPDRRRRAIVFQDGRLMPWRSVADNVAYGLKGLSLTHEQRERRVAAALELTGLSAFAERWPAQLSGGQAQRAGIARALAVEPDLLLMDEPFSAVDAITRRGLQDELNRIWRASGAGVLFVTHDIEEAVYLADRVVLLAGQPAEAVLDREIESPRPRDRRSARLDDDVRLIADAMGAT